MTLLVAAVDGAQVWMMADTALDDPKLALRERSFKVKIAPVQGCSLIGFAESAELGPDAIAKASLETPGVDTLQLLLAEHRRSAYNRVGIVEFAVDFAYAFLDHGQPQLVRVTGGEAIQLPTLHLGQHDAFEAFQRIRHDPALDHPPEAILTLLLAVPDPHPPPPDALRRAVLAMQRLVMLKGDYTVGGLVIPYILSGDGASLCTYAFSATDPIVSRLAPGDRIPHGTAAGGGFGVSLTELREKDGIVAYWPQKPGGRVYVRDRDWYAEHDFEGPPTVFTDIVRKALGREIDVWFGDQPAPPPESISTLADQHGRPRVAVSQANAVLSFNWIQGTEDSFSLGSAIKIERKSD